MASMLSLSKRQPDLLASGDVEEVFVSDELAQKKGAPSNSDNSVAHPLAAPDSRVNVRDYIESKRTLAGNAYAEQLVNELHAASNINRGPPGVFESSRLHWDLLLGRDESIYPSDYLNYDSLAKF